ncbi:hypothetical protein FB45DRAFT_1053144 [Roridomyces roridus]|uniref:Uncharacterized protein n=1 Tax=Roridomyces roridus TaxID=1738132 RepID=A0AAD7FYM0_9AGAR|nr:hypothetical protein FB45DRAFT_1053144 [Roridomyces roridus]
MISLIPLTIAAALVSLCPAAAAPATVAASAIPTVTVTVNASVCTPAVVPIAGVPAQPVSPAVASAVDNSSALLANATAALNQLVTTTYGLSATVQMIQNAVIANQIPAQLITNEQQNTINAAAALRALAASNVPANAASLIASIIQMLVNELAKLPSGSAFTNQFLDDFRTLLLALQTLAKGPFAGQPLFLNATVALAAQIAALQ